MLAYSGHRQIALGEVVSNCTWEEIRRLGSTRDNCETEKDVRSLGVVERVSRNRTPVPRMSSNKLNGERSLAASRAELVQPMPILQGTRSYPRNFVVI